MQNHSYKLQPYGNGKGTRHICPSCGIKKQFARYINTDTNEYLADYVGRCNSENSCAYHYTPREYFESNPDKAPEFPKNQTRKLEPKKKPSFIDPAYVESRRIGYDSNTFIIYLVSLFGSEITKKLIELYDIGTCNERWPGAAIFWVRDKEGRVRAGQVKHFDEYGHTGSYLDNEGNKHSKTGWIHKHLEFKYSRKNCSEKQPSWLTAYLENPECWPCLFGEHLLSSYPNKPVAIVEAPKTAIIASIYFPDFVWLAVGSKSNFSTNNTGRLSAIKGKTVCMFPDLKAFEEWSHKAEKLSYLAYFHVSNFLELNSAEEEKVKGLDLADYLTLFPYTDFAPALEEAPVLPLEQETNCTTITRAREEEPTPLSKASIYLPKEKELWDLSELEVFFAGNPAPSGPVQLYPWAKITDAVQFIQSHLSYLRAQNGNRSALPHLERLERLKSIMEGKAIQVNHTPLLHSAA